MPEFRPIYLSAPKKKTSTPEPTAPATASSVPTGRNNSWSGRYVSFPTATRRRILQRDNHTCRSCGEPATIADHIIPLAEGGTHDENNGQALCEPCHDAKTKQEIARGRARKSRTRPAQQHPGLRGASPGGA